MSLIDSISTVAQEIGVPAPPALVGSTNAADAQMLAIANTAIRRIVDPWPWTKLITDYTFTFTNAEDEYPLPADFGKPINQTAWDSSLRRPLNGPVNPQDWIFFKEYGVSGGVWPRYRIKGNTIQIDPVPATGALDTAVMAYFSKYGVLLATPAGGFDYGRTFAADDDGFFCNEHLFELEFKWRYLRAKGLDYAEEMADAQNALFEWLTSDGSKVVIDAADSDLRQVPNTIPGNIIGPFP